MTTYIAYLLCHHRARGQIFLDDSTEEPVAFFVMPWTCLLLIRASRHIDSGSTVPQGRAQFEGILRPVSDI